MTQSYPNPKSQQYEASIRDSGMCKICIRFISFPISKTTLFSLFDQNHVGGHTALNPLKTNDCSLKIVWFEDNFPFWNAPFLGDMLCVCRGSPSKIQKEKDKHLPTINFLGSMSIFCGYPGIPRNKFSKSCTSHHEVVTAQSTPTMELAATYQGRWAGWGWNKVWYHVDITYIHKIYQTEIYHEESIYSIFYLLRSFDGV